MPSVAGIDIAVPRATLTTVSLATRPVRGLMRNCNRASTGARTRPRQAQGFLVVSRSVPLAFTADCQGQAHDDCQRASQNGEGEDVRVALFAQSADVRTSILGRG